MRLPSAAVVRNSSQGPPGRLRKKRLETRARLLQAAYEVMSEHGIDASKIQDITDLADVGFGTFYNYFHDKNQLAAEVLDCLINDFGRRNVLATSGMGQRDPATIMPVSIRLILREVMSMPIWQWWALRPDLLVDRMREGFGPFGIRDIQRAVEEGIFHLAPEEISSAWAISIWTMVAGIHDVVVGDSPPDSERFVTELIMRQMGMDIESAKRVSSTSLPPYPPSTIDWTFMLHAEEQDA